MAAAAAADADGEDDPTASAGIWIGLSILSFFSFYAQALVTEERFVPAVNVIATHWNMPPDIAGATIMAAAASSPELFASFLSLFVTHSSLGLGTIVGSEIFNQLVIVAGSIQYARNNRLKLDRAILTREVLFYALSLVLFWMTLTDRQPTDDDEFNNHIYIGLGDGLLLLGGYVLYVVVCAYFKQIIGIVDRLQAAIGKTVSSSNDETTRCSGSDGLEYSAYNEEDAAVQATISRQATIDVPEMPFLRQLSHEPRANFHSVLSQDDLFSLNDGDVISDIDPLPPPSGDEYSISSNDAANDTDAACVGCTSPRRLLHAVLSSSSKKPSQLHDLDEIERNADNGDASCFLWQQSNFYTKTRVDLNAWHLRWFTFSDAFVESVPNRRDFNLHRLRYAGFSDLQVDNDHLVMKFNCSTPETREVVLMAPSRKVLELAVKSCERIMADQEELVLPDSFDSMPSGVGNFGNEVEEIRSLIEFPDSGASSLLVGIHVILLPVKALVHYTVPDVRILPPEKSSIQRTQAIVSILSCLVWIIVSSLAMCWSLESLGALMGISDMLMGVTISAAGTSLPVLVASCICARQGLGNMAVSNTFGSNSFNILLGLGLPWTLYCAFASGGEPYHGIVDEGITESAFWLSGVLLVFIVLVVASKFVLYRWHAWVFVVLYVAYVVYAVLQDLGLLHL